MLSNNAYTVFLDNDYTAHFDSDCGILLTILWFDENTPFSGYLVTTLFCMFWIMTISYVFLTLLWIDSTHSSKPAPRSPTGTANTPTPKTPSVPVIICTSIPLL